MRRSRISITSCALVASFLLAACKDGEQAAPVPGSLTATVAATQTGTVGAAVAVPPAVLVKDTKGNIMANVPVTFSVTAGGGTVTGATATTGVDGVARVGSWTLGTASGANTLSATVSGVAPVVFTATAAPGAPATVTVTGGNAQTGMVNTALTTPLSVTVRDAHGNVVPDAQVAFSPGTSNGTIASPTAATNAQGVATAGIWTIGTVAGAQTLTATTGTAAPATFTATATPGPATGVNLNGAVVGGTVGAALSTNPAIKVADQFGNGIAGRQVVFAVASGGGTVSGATQTTDASGIARVGSWTLGTAAGQQSLTATVAGLPPLTLVSIAAPGAPAVTAKNAGDAQTGPAGSPVAVAPSIIVRDQFNNLVPNTQVTFTVTSGGGNVGNPTATTGTNGIASAGTWVLGEGTNTLTAQVIGQNPIVFTATGTAPIPNSGYKIDIRFVGAAPNARQQQAVNLAIARWQGIITGDLSDIDTRATPIAANQCGTHPAIAEIIDDVIIFVDFSDIDGPGNILGQAGPCFTRNSNGLSVIGRLRLDNADLINMDANGTIDAVVAHEIGHVLGIGSLWNSKGMMQNLQTDSSRFIGGRAAAAFLAAGGGALFTGTPTPAENCINATGGVISGCGAGTRDVHWREFLMGRELMTGYVSAGVNPLSLITIQSLADLGYTVNTSVADNYTVSPSLMAPGSVEPSVFKLNELPRNWKIKTLDGNGRVVRVID